MILAQAANPDGSNFRKGQPSMGEVSTIGLDIANLWVGLAVECGRSRRTCDLTSSIAVRLNVQSRSNGWLYDA